jgi:hypothetical protein
MAMSDIANRNTTDKINVFLSAGVGEIDAFGMIDLQHHGRRTRLSHMLQEKLTL